MGILILVSGANNSGKSQYAESLVSRTKGQRFYIATMSPQTEENHQRIAKHRRQRQGLNFTTLELPRQIGNAAVEKDSVVLLEDVSNLFGNAYFETHSTVEQVLEDIENLQNRCRMLFAVTIGGLRSENYQGETADYIRGLCALNDALRHRAEVSVVMKNGEPWMEKGNLHDFI